MAPATFNGTLNVRRAINPLYQMIGRRLRWIYYVGGHNKAVERLSAPLRAKLGLTDAAALLSRRVEIGGGPRPLPGYIHVDQDRNAAHLESLAPAWRLPFSKDWADEIVAVHALEHVHPQMLLPTLTEWIRVLRPGGLVRIHVPNSSQIMERFISASLPEKWALMGGLLGMYVGPDCVAPEGIPSPSDHQVLFDAEVMRWCLEEVGFHSVTNISEEVSDFHTEAWQPLVRRYSLIFEGQKPN